LRRNPAPIQQSGNSSDETMATMRDRTGSRPNSSPSAAAQSMRLYRTPPGHNTTRIVCKMISRSNSTEKFFT